MIQVHQIRKSNIINIIFIKSPEQKGIPARSWCMTNSLSLCFSYLLDLLSSIGTPYSKAFFLDMRFLPHSSCLGVRLISLCNQYASPWWIFQLAALSIISFVFEFPGGFNLMPSNRTEQPLITRFAWNGVNPSSMSLSPRGCLWDLKPWENVYRGGICKFCSWNACWYHQTFISDGDKAALASLLFDDALNLVLRRRANPISTVNTKHSAQH